MNAMSMQMLHEMTAALENAMSDDAVPRHRSDRIGAGVLCRCGSQGSRRFQS